MLPDIFNVGIYCRISQENQKAHSPKVRQTKKKFLDSDSKQCYNSDEQCKSAFVGAKEI